MSEYIVRMPSDMPYEIKAELNAWYVNSEPIVRCRDCEFGAYNGKECMRIDEMDGSLWFPVEPDGFCAWGVRETWTTCKCGEEIEIGNRESVVCPSCGRMVRS